MALVSFPSVPTPANTTVGMACWTSLLRWVQSETMGPGQVDWAQRANFARASFSLPVFRRSCPPSCAARQAIFSSLACA